jgi:hypothetical protein
MQAAGSSCFYGVPPKLRDRILAALRSPEAAQAEPAENIYTKRRIAEIIEEGDGFWLPCSGCQESSDGYVSVKDYPYSPTFRCQPGSGCGECGGIGVIWNDTDYSDYGRDAVIEPAQTDQQPPEKAMVEVCAILADLYEIRMLPRCIHEDVYKGAAKHIFAALQPHITAREEQARRPLISALEQAIGWFEGYAEGHAAKSTLDGDEKAQRNRDRAAILKAAIRAKAGEER